jgi:hypothetical protein
VADRSASETPADGASVGRWRFGIRMFIAHGSSQRSAHQPLVVLHRAPRSPTQQSMMMP